MALNEQKKRFADKYFETLNASQSAIYAGFSEETARQSGYQVLQRDDVQEYLSKLREEYAEKAGVSREWVLERFKLISDACVQATPVMEFDPVEKKMVHKGLEYGEPLYEFDSAGANSATTQIGKIIGAYEKDNGQKNTIINVSLSKEEAKAIAKNLEDEY